MKTEQDLCAICKVLMSACNEHIKTNQFVLRGHVPTNYNHILQPHLTSVHRLNSVDKCNTSSEGLATSDLINAQVSFYIHIDSGFANKV